MNISSVHLHKTKRIGAVFALSGALAFLTACEPQTRTGTTESTQDSETETETPFGARDQQEQDPAAQQGEPELQPDPSGQQPQDEVQPQRNLELQEQLQEQGSQQPEN